MTKQNPRGAVLASPCTTWHTTYAVFAGEDLPSRRISPYFSTRSAAEQFQRANGGGGRIWRWESD